MKHPNLPVRAVLEIRLINT